MSKIEVSLIIVNYKTPQLLLSCVSSVYKYSKGFSFEVIVIDNDSKDESKKLLLTNHPGVKWIDMGSNEGFGKANNKGVENSIGEYVLLLNSDTELYENCILNTLNYHKELSKKTKLGLLGCKIQNRDFSLQPSCNYYFPGLKDTFQENPLVLFTWVRLFNQKILKDIDKYDKMVTNHEVVWLGVPYALIKKSTFIEVGGFDDDFFMYSEDKELNYRLSKKGYSNYFYAGTGIFHVNGGSSGFVEKRVRQISVSKWLFILKAKGHFYYWIFITLQFTNFIFDDFFFFLSKMRGSVKNSDLEAKAQRLLVKKWIINYGIKIPFKFKKSTSGSNISLNTYND